MADKLANNAVLKIPTLIINNLIDKNELPITLPEIITISKQRGSLLIPYPHEHVDHIMKMIYLFQMHKFHKLKCEEFSSIHFH